jgi:PBP1b-binding outer membrane lipoprotein LpoB
MKQFSSLTVLVLLLLTGCARNYVITLNNGTQIGAKGKPKLENGSYVFKDARGQDAAVAAGRVSQIEPAREAEKQNKSGFIPR